MTDENSLTVAPQAPPAAHLNPPYNRALVGKIARLPKIIREKLNRRLDDNQPASEILPWLNALPIVQRILAAQFNGAPVNDQNLSIWRATGYQRWLQKLEPLDDLKYLSEEAADFSRATRGRLARGAASIAAARLLKYLNGLSLENCSVTELVNISYAITALFHADQSQVRLWHDKKRIRLRDEQLTLSWDKHQRDSTAIGLRVLDDAQAKAIHAKPVSYQEKIEMLGRRLYGKHWRGKRIPGPSAK
jgi:hypothetical protein